MTSLAFWYISTKKKVEISILFNMLNFVKFNIIYKKISLITYERIR